jgi:DNA (cytosine-5)-methyltransferase 1
MDFRFIDLFAGIGWIRLWFEKAFWKWCVFSSEFDKFCQITYWWNHWDTPHGDITKIDEKTIPNFDILLAWFPCQPFSNAGLRKGFEDSRWTLFFDIARIVKHHKPRVVFLENVKWFRNHDEGNTFKVVTWTLEDLWYKIYSKVLNARDFWVPQNRERIYIIWFLDDVDFEFPTPHKNSVKLWDILEDKVDAKYTISDKLWAGHQRRKQEHKEKWNWFWYSLFNKDSAYTSTISARYYKDGSEILIEQKGKNPRKITPREAARLQWYPEEFQIMVSDTQAYKQFWNSVCVLVIEALARQVKKAIYSFNKKKWQKN